MARKAFFRNRINKLWVAFCNSQNYSETVDSLAKCNHTKLSRCFRSLIAP